MAHYEPGDYLCRVVDQRFGQTPNNSAYFQLEFEPMQALGANTFPEQVYNRHTNLFITEKSHQYTIEKLRALGFTGTKFAQLDLSHPQAHSFVGQEVKMTCSHDGQYENWELARDKGSGTPKESDPSVAAKLDGMFGKSLMVAIPAGDKKPKAAPKPAAVAPGGDEIPF